MAFIQDLPNLVSEKLATIGLLKPLHKKELIITEKGANKNTTLKNVQITQIPDGVWVLDNEFAENESVSFGGSKTEKTLLYVHNDRLYVIMLEMKSSNEDTNLSKLKKKLTHSLTAVSIYLSGHTHFQKFQNTEIYPVGIYCFNKELTISKSPNSDKNDTYKLYLKKCFGKNEKKMLLDIEPATFYEKIPTPVYCLQNPDYQANEYANSEGFEINFMNFLA